jgi:hypothetical protein
MGTAGNNSAMEPVYVCFRYFQHPVSALDIDVLNEKVGPLWIQKFHDHSLPQGLV